MQQKTSECGQAAQQVGRRSLRANCDRQAGSRWARLLWHQGNEQLGTAVSSAVRYERGIAMAVLRHVVGETLRAVRLRQRRTLREVSAAARVSLGYLSEIERGHKEPSSELLAAICEALDVPLSEVFMTVSDSLRRQERMADRAMIIGSRTGGPVLTPAGHRDADGPQVRSFPTVAA